MMRVASLLAVLSLLAPSVGSTARFSEQAGTATRTLANERLRLSFDLERGLFDLQTAAGETVVAEAFFQAGGLQSKDPCDRRTAEVTEVRDELGRGRRLTVRAEHAGYVDTVWHATLYDGASFVVFGMGIDNDTAQPYRLSLFSPLSSTRVFEGIDNTARYQTLDGAGGGGRTQVTSDVERLSFNSLLARFGPTGAPRILVAGGLTYHEFEKFVRLRREDKRLTLSVYAEDPVGRLIDPGTRYLPDERFYLSTEASDPFEALERYAAAVKTAQGIALNMYDFPTECLWYASFYNNEKGRPKFNDSKGAVEEMERAVASGITRFSRVAIRLVPDAYTPDNQQGWWDDEHWGMYGQKMSTEGPHYVAPYATTRSWAGAVRDKGGIPITYVQSGRRSEDFAKAHPEFMLFNDSFRPIVGRERFKMHPNFSPELEENYYRYWWADKMLWGYDFTDPGFLGHLRRVYANLRDGGIQGVMFDYPMVTAWAFEGGFEDKHATTAAAYRNMFRAALDGLGNQAYLDERNVERGSDIALGLVASQRVWADNDGIEPEMVARAGLRWYKNRVLVNYDLDSKDPSDAWPTEHQDGSRAMLTMTYVVSGRFLVGRSFSQLTPQQLHDLSRVVPYHTEGRSARPLDAFAGAGEWPRVYDFAVSPTWHQLTLYNWASDQKTAAARPIGVTLAASPDAGGLGLDPSRDYYVYDFWNDRLVGRIPGSGRIEQEVRPGEARMLSVRAVERVPQLIATDRHVMQGYVDVKQSEWDPRAKTLHVVSQLVAGDPYTAVVATNGLVPGGCVASGATCVVRQAPGGDGLLKVTLNTKAAGATRWSLRFK